MSEVILTQFETITVNRQLFETMKEFIETLLEYDEIEDYEDEDEAKSLIYLANQELIKQ